MSEDICGEVARCVAGHCEEAIKLRSELATLREQLEGLKEMIDDAVSAAHALDSDDIGPGLKWARIGEVIETLADYESALSALPSSKKKGGEDFFCCKDQDDPCHPIRDYCSNDRRPKPNAR